MRPVRRQLFPYMETLISLGVLEEINRAGRVLLRIEMVARISISMEQPSGRFSMVMSAAITMTVPQHGARKVSLFRHAWLILLQIFTGLG